MLGSGELDSSLIDDPTGALNTDIQVWRESTDNRRSFTSCECRELARIYTSDKSEIASAATPYASNHQRHCKRVGGGGAFDSASTVATSSNPDGIGHTAVPGGSSTSSGASSTSSSSPTTSSYDMSSGSGDNESSACDNPDGDASVDDDDETSNLVEAALPAAVDKRERSKEFEIRKLKSNCKPEELQKLKLQCEVSFKIFIVDTFFSRWCENVGAGWVRTQYI